MQIKMLQTCQAHGNIDLISKGVNELTPLSFINLFFHF